MTTSRPGEPAETPGSGSPPTNRLGPDDQGITSATDEGLAAARPTGPGPDVADPAGGARAASSSEQGGSARSGESAPDAAATAALARARGAAAARGMNLSRGRPVSRPAAGGSHRPRLGEDRDPVVLGQQVDRLVGEQGWVLDVAAGTVMARWPVIAGADIASHVTPTGFEDGVLTVRAESTAWATQLRYLQTSLLRRIDEEIGQGTVTALRVVGPSAPSWSRGRRRARGRGPRDTYG